MATKNDLCATATVSTLANSDYIFVDIDGKVRRIKVADFVKAIELRKLDLRTYAWGVPIKQALQSSQDWGVIGNTTLRDSYLSKVGRYLLTNAGKAAKCSATDSTKFADGTAVDQSKGHMMTMGPTLYYEVEMSDAYGCPVLWMSEYPISRHCIENPCYGCFQGYNRGGKLTSISGVVPTASQTIAQFWNLAQANGTMFGLCDYENAFKWFTMLQLSKFGNPNVQTKIGYGVGGSQSLDLWATAQKLTTGATLSLGDACGAIPIEVVNGDKTGVNCSHVSLFGIEDLWNLRYEMIQGIYFGSSANIGQDGSECFIYNENRMPTSAELASHPTCPYRKIYRPNSSGYVSEMQLGENFDLIAKAMSGSSTSYWGDSQYHNTTGQLCLAFASATHGSDAGAVHVDSHLGFSRASSLCGARLAFFGKPVIVTGAELMGS